jgi:hypothetical protein
MSLPAAAVGGGGTIIIKVGCCGCNDTSGFTATVACGASASYFTCGTCGGAGLGVGSTGGTPTTSVSRVQTCH